LGAIWDLEKRVERNKKEGFDGRRGFTVRGTNWLKGNEHQETTAAETSDAKEKKTKKRIFFQ